jgi:hypothetical protein
MPYSTGNWYDRSPPRYYNEWNSFDYEFDKPDFDIPPNQCVILYGFFLKKTELLKALLISLRKDTIHMVISKLHPSLPLELANVIAYEVTRDLPSRWSQLYQMRLFNVLPGQSDVFEDDVEWFYTTFDGFNTVPDHPDYPMTETIEITRARMEAKLSRLAVCVIFSLSLTLD